MAPSIKAVVASGLLLLAAPLVKADARSCGLCIETAINQAHDPVCTGIFEQDAVNDCLCAPGNKPIFDHCESKCAGLPNAPSSVCSVPTAKPDLRTCTLCWETATNQAHTPICTGLNPEDTEACLCKQGNRDIFDTCNAQCAGFPVKQPKNVCPELATRADDNTCGKCWNHEVNTRCPPGTGPFEEQKCLCSKKNRKHFINTCGKACAKSIPTPAQFCANTKAPLDTRDDAACSACWNAEIAQFCPDASGLGVALCLCSPGIAEQFIGACSAPCAGTLGQPEQVCVGANKRSESSLSSRQDDAACAACWNEAGDEMCPWATDPFSQQLCLCSPANAANFIAKCDPPCANSVVQPSDACAPWGKRSPQIAGGGPCGPVPGTACNLSASSPSSTSTPQ